MENASRIQLKKVNLKKKKFKKALYLIIYYLIIGCPLGRVHNDQPELMAQLSGGAFQKVSELHLLETTFAPSFCKAQSTSTCPVVCIHALCPDCAMLVDYTRVPC